MHASEHLELALKKRGGNVNDLHRHGWNGRWTARHWRRGALLWEMVDAPNALMDEGEEQILDVYLRAAAAPSSHYFGLGNNGGTPGVPAETATLAGITEVSGAGYGRIAVARNTTDWPTLALDAGDFQASSAVKQFSATGTWTAADYLFLTTVASGTAGKLIATIALSASRVLLNGDKLDVSLKVKLQ
jgi:hypothetical protein